MPEIPSSQPGPRTEPTPFDIGALIRQLNEAAYKQGEVDGRDPFASDAKLKKYDDATRAALNRRLDAVRMIQQALGEKESQLADVRDLLRGDHLECCGCPTEGHPSDGYFQPPDGPQCCGCPEPVKLNDAQIVRSLRAQFKETA